MAAKGYRISHSKTMKIIAEFDLLSHFKWTKKQMKEHALKDLGYWSIIIVAQKEKANQTAKPNVANLGRKK